MICLASLPTGVKMLLVNEQHQITALLSLLEEMELMTNKDITDSNGAHVVKPSNKVCSTIEFFLYNSLNLA